MQRIAVALAASTLFLLSAGAAEAGEAKGTLTHPRGTLALKYAYLVKGPDAVDPAISVRRLILSAEDLGAKLAACTTMSCTDGEVTEGMTVDLDGGPRLNYWMAIKGGMVQYSGTEKLEALKTRSDEPGKLAGTLSLDDTGSGGPKVEVEFDAALLKELDKAR
jgi:hypothetical protein